jgi:hypothetical protein
MELGALGHIDRYLGACQAVPEQMQGNVVAVRQGAREFAGCATDTSS